MLGTDTGDEKHMTCKSVGDDGPIAGGAGGEAIEYEAFTVHVESL